MTWKGRYGLPSDTGTSTLSSDDTVTSGCDSEIDDRNWSMSAFCSWSNSSAGKKGKMTEYETGWHVLIPVNLGHGSNVFHQLLLTELLLLLQVTSVPISANYQLLFF